MQQDIGVGKAPEGDKGLGVRGKVVAAEHHAFGAARRARGVKDRGQVIGIVGRVAEIGGLGGGGGQKVGQRGTARAGRGDGQAAVGVGDGQRGFGIGQEVLRLGQGIGGVDRQEHDPGAQAGQVKGQDLGAFLGLQEQAVAFGQAQRVQGVGQPGRRGQEVGVGGGRIVQKPGPVRRGGGPFQCGDDVGRHACPPGLPHYAHGGRSCNRQRGWGRFSQGALAREDLLSRRRTSPPPRHLGVFHPQTPGGYLGREEAGKIRRG